jgi:hypothetical protein
MRLDVNDPPVVAEVGRDVDRRGHDGRRVDGRGGLGGGGGAIALAPIASADTNPLVPYGTNPHVPSLGYHESNHDEANSTNGFIDVPF